MREREREEGMWRKRNLAYAIPNVVSRHCSVCMNAGNKN